MKIKGIKICDVLEITGIEGNSNEIIQITRALVVLGIAVWSLANKEKIKEVSEKIIDKITKENRLMESGSNQEN